MNETSRTPHSRCQRSRAQQWLQSRRVGGTVSASPVCLKSHLHDDAPNSSHHNLELRHLRYFVAVAEAENVLRAATQKLHVSQPAVSRQIRDLEDELGVQLFERTGKAVSLTDAGRVFLREARAVLERTDEAVKNVRAFAQTGETELHVGYAPTVSGHILSA